jgi:transcriptional regulator with XRE-family HTH domain
MCNDAVRLGNRIRTARRNKELTQVEVSNLLGISQTAYSRLEGGQSSVIDISLLYQISSILDVSIMWLLDENYIISELTDRERLEVEKFIRYIISIRKKD